MTKFEKLQYKVGELVSDNNGRFAIGTVTVVLLQYFSICAWAIKQTPATKGIAIAVNAIVFIVSRFINVAVDFYIDTDFKEECKRLGIN